MSKSSLLICCYTCENEADVMTDVCQRSLTLHWFSSANYMPAFLVSYGLWSQADNNSHFQAGNWWLNCAFEIFEIIKLISVSAGTVTLKDIWLNIVVRNIWSFFSAYFMYCVALLALMISTQQDISDYLWRNMTCHFLQPMAISTLTLEKVLSLMRYESIKHAFIWLWCIHFEIKS